MNYFLPLAKITRDQGKLFETSGRFVLPMLHPAAALRGTEAMNMFEDTFKKLPNVLKKVNGEEVVEAKVVKEPSKKEKKIEDVQTRLF